MIVLGDLLLTSFPIMCNRIIIPVPWVHALIVKFKPWPVTHIFLLFSFILFSIKLNLEIHGFIL